MAADAVFNRVLGAYEALTARHGTERDILFASIKDNYGVKGGLLELLEETNLRASPQHEGQMMIQHLRMKIYVTRFGCASLDFGEGDVVDFHDERFKQLYAHLKKTYEEQRRRKVKVRPIPF